MLQGHEVVAEPARHPRLEAGLAAQAQSQICHVGLGNVQRPGLGGEGGQDGRTARGGEVRGGDQHDRVGGQRHDVEVRTQWQLDKIGGRDDHVGIAAAQGGNAGVRFQLQKLDLQLRMLGGESGDGRQREGPDGALERTKSHQPGCFLAEPTQLRLDSVHVVEDCPRPTGQHLPGRRQPHPAAGAFQQACPGFGLQHRQLLEALRFVSNATARIVPSVSNRLSSRSRHGFSMEPIVVRSSRTGKPEL